MKRCTLRRWLSVILGLWLIFGIISPLLAAEEIKIREFSFTPLDNNPDILLANLKLDYNLGNYLREGLLNGMTLESEIHFDLEWHSDWWWNTRKSLAVVKSELKYHALSQHYQLLRLDTNENWNFPTLASALERMGTLKDYMLPDLPEDVHHNNASIVVYSRLAPKALQLPLKIQKLFAERDSLESEGVVWSIP